MNLTEWARAQGVHPQTAGRRLVVLEDGEVAGDLVRDVVEVLTGFVLACTVADRCGIGR